MSSAKQVLYASCRCPLCWHKDASVRTDKNGRPYMTCRACGGKMFGYSQDAVNGMQFWGKSGDSIVAKLDAMVRELRKGSGVEAPVERAG